MSRLRRCVASGGVIATLFAGAVNACANAGRGPFDGTEGGGATSGDFGTSGGGSGLTDADLTREAACAEATAPAQIQPLDVYFVLDRSDSMGADCPLGSELGSKWCRASNALAHYFRSSVTQGHRAALQYFALESASCSTGQPHDVPAIDLTPLPVLPNHALLKSIENAAPVSGLGTLIESAERGITAFTKRRRTPGRTMVGVLITDGDPQGGCANDTTSLAKILSDHLDDTGIRTFVIGMTGATASNLEAIALGGGAPAHGPEHCSGESSCHYYSVGDGEAGAFAAALGAIQQASLGCTLRVPIPEGKTIDPNQVKVEYLVGGAGPGRALTRVLSAISCVGDGWYYDDNANPSSVHLCREICAEVKDDPGAKVDVFFGCVKDATPPK